MDEIRMDKRIEEAVNILASVDPTECWGTGDCDDGFGEYCRLSPLCKDLHGMAERIQNLRKDGNI